MTDPTEPETEDIFRLDIDGRSFVIVGTAHISKQSTELVRRVIEEEKPDCVCVELDERRYKALSDPTAWEKLDLKQIIKRKQLLALIAHLVISSYQKKLGAQLGVKPGTELLEATKAATEHDIPLELVDRDISITLKRAWKMTKFHRKLTLLATAMASLFESPEIDDAKIEEIKKQDVLTQVLTELGEELPEIKTALIDERDTYLAEKTLAAKGQKVVSIVGAGHVQGIIKQMKQSDRADLSAIEAIPPSAPYWKWLGYAIPALIVGSIVTIGLKSGAAAALTNSKIWFLCNGLLCGLGAVLALAHPLTILASFVAAPFTSLTPLIGAGYVAAFVQVWLSPPTVKDLHDVGESLGKPKEWWKNRLLRVFLVFLLTSLGSVAGTYVAALEIFQNAHDAIQSGS